jgi:hypothetical protein
VLGGRMHEGLQRRVLMGLGISLKLLEVTDVKVGNFCPR